ncbi:MAG: DUF4625 domain-containing protein [Paludibacter sp.]|nr:DUF4625 domain-containing protein [Paludibacter sp.]
MLLVACVETDDEIPVIDMSSDNAFPQNCVTVYRGESFTFHARFTDNVELGSYSIELHNNFDHHTHSTSVVECELEPVKKAVNPLLFIKEFSIPRGLTEYTASVTIDVPADVDTGDYHFMVRVTDKSGWQTFEGINIKIAKKWLL